MLEKQAKQEDSDPQNIDPNSFNDILGKAKEKGVELSFEDIREIQKQTKKVRLKYFGTKEWLRAPNGKESKLTEGQWLAVRTPHFKAWFGDWENNPREASKTIDLETGEPKVYFHGGARDISMFKSLADRTGDEYDNHGIYFSPNPEASSNFAILKSEKVETGVPVVFPVFLCLKKPKMVQYSRQFDKTQRDALIEAGFDGAIELGGEKDGYYQDSIIVVFQGNQVKSAVGNIGTFSKNSDDVSL